MQTKKTASRFRSRLAAKIRVVNQEAVLHRIIDCSQGKTTVLIVCYWEATRKRLRLHIAETFRVCIVLPYTIGRPWNIEYL